MILMLFVFRSPNKNSNGMLSGVASFTFLSPYFCVSGIILISGIVSARFNEITNIDFQYFIQDFADGGGSREQWGGGTFYIG